MDVLRRRKQTLASFLQELGFTTHGALTNWCDRMGVVTPTDDEFHVAVPMGTYVNSAAEGVIVIGPPDEPVALRNALVELTPKRPRRKKDPSDDGTPGDA